MRTAFIKEIFSSIQGEALYIGEKQLFIRFCGCNLKCAYCDTDHTNNETFFVQELNKEFKNPVSAEVLAEIANSFKEKTISLTGGEPLLHKDFLKSFIKKLDDKKIYLETNGVLYQELAEIIELVDVVSMDIKLPCSTAQKAQFDENRKFIEVATKAAKEIFAKIVLDKNYSKNELISAVEILKEFEIPLIIQPMDCKDKLNELNKTLLIELVNFTLEHYPKTRLIPQVHKFLSLL